MDFFNNFSLSTFLASVAGSGVLGVGAAKWLSGYLSDRWIANHKAELDKEFEAYRDSLEQKRKRLEAELSHGIYTTQIQFDTEFNAIKDIFANLGKLKLSFGGLRPILDWLPSDTDDRIREVAARLDPFIDYYNASVTAVESVYPFVPEDIYAQFQECMKAAMLEIRHIKEVGGIGATSPKGYQQGVESLDRFCKAYFLAAKMARERFQRMSVVSVR
jgi:hypothetical protein